MKYSSFGVKSDDAKCQFPDQFVQEKFKFWSENNAFINNTGSVIPAPSQDDGQHPVMTMANYWSIFDGQT